MFYRFLARVLFLYFGFYFCNLGINYMFNYEGYQEKKEIQKQEKIKNKEIKKAEKKEKKRREKEKKQAELSIRNELFSASIDSLIDSVVVRPLDCYVKERYNDRKVLYVCFNKKLSELADRYEIEYEVNTISGLRQYYGNSYIGIPHYERIESQYCNDLCLQKHINYNERLRQPDYDKKTERYRYKVKYESEVQNNQIANITLFVSDKNDSELKATKVFTSF